METVWMCGGIFGCKPVAIRFHTNPVYLLASILTLGLYVPQNVTWWCGTEVTDCADGDQSEDCEPYVREDE